MDLDRKILLIYMMSTTFIVFSGKLLVPTLSGNIEDSLKINHTEFGLGMTLLWLFYGLMQFPSGVIADEKGGKPVVNIGIFIFAFAFFIMSIAKNYLLFLLSLILMGIGFGCFYNVSLKMISNRFYKKRGKLFGIQSAVGSLAGLSPLIILPLTNEIGWRILILIWAVTSLSIGFFFFKDINDKNDKSQNKKDGIKSGLKILRDKNVLLLLSINAIMSFCWFGIISFLPIYLIEVKGISDVNSGIIFSFIFFAGIFLRPLMGHLSDFYSKKKLLLFLLFVASFSCFLIAKADTIYMLILATTMSSSISAFYPIRSAYLMGKWPKKSYGSRMGMYVTMVLILSSSSPLIIGYLLNLYNFQTIFIIFSAIIFITAMFLLLSNYFYNTIKSKLSILHKIIDFH